MDDSSSGIGGACLFIFENVAGGLFASGAVAREIDAGALATFTLTLCAGVGAVVEETVEIEVRDETSMNSFSLQTCQEALMKVLKTKKLIAKKITSFDAAPNMISDGMVLVAKETCSRMGRIASWFLISSSRISPLTLKAWK